MSGSQQDVMKKSAGRRPLPAAVARLYPFESHYLDLDGHAYHYLDEGRGETLVMVHGNPTWSFYFRHLVTGLRDQYRVVVPDHMGCGLSDNPSDQNYSFTLAQRVSDLERLIDHLGLKRVTLVLHDWGGMIGMAFAARHPHRIQRLIVANTAAFPLPKTKAMPLALSLCRTPGLGSLLVRGFNAFSLGAAATCVTRRPMTDAVRAGYLAPYDSWANRRAVLRFVQDIPLSVGDESYQLVSDTADKLGDLSGVPLQIFWGAKDFVFDDHFLAEWQRRFPAAEVHRFADCGHYVLEDAADEILPLIKSFLASTGDGAGH